MSSRPVVFLNILVTVHKRTTLNILTSLKSLTNLKSLRSLKIVKCFNKILQLIVKKRIFNSN